MRQNEAPFGACLECWQHLHARPEGNFVERLIGTKQARAEYREAVEQWNTMLRNDGPGTDAFMPAYQRLTNAEMSLPSRRHGMR